MDYYPGGDLLTLISKFDERLPEQMAKFYVAEMVLAIESIHRLGYVHRDIKPDNILLDKNGHLKLGDFGSCLQMRPDGSVQSKTSVGTPDYISPEILQANEDGQGKYGKECDWWSLGVCIYEMLFGETPFYAESLVETYGKIMNHKERFYFPDYETDVSTHAKDLIRSLICDRSERFGQNGLVDFQSHPFLFEIDFINIRETQPPYVPEIASATDTSNFDPDLDEGQRFPTQAPVLGNNTFSGRNLPFAGFTFSSGSKLSDLGMKQLLSETTRPPTPPSSSPASIDMEEKLEETRKREAELQLKLKEATAKIDELSLECEQLKTSKTSLLKKYEQNVFDENEALYRKLRRSENDLRQITSQIEQLRQEYQAAEDAKRSLAQELTLVETQRQEQDNYIKSLKAEYDQLLVSKNEDYKYSNRIEHLQNEIDKKQAELFEMRKSNQKSQLRHGAECDELQRRLDEAVERGVTQRKQAEVDSEQKLDKLRQEYKQLEEELELSNSQQDQQRGKEQWEQYLGNIVQWVYDEKDARAYLEQLATRMGDELEALKMARNSQCSLQKHLNFSGNGASVSATAGGGNATNGNNDVWKTMRRHKIKNSQLLELQSTLQDEIQLRHQITSELTEEQQTSQRLEMENIELKQKLVELMMSEELKYEHQTTVSSHNSPAPSLSHSSIELNKTRTPQILSINDPSLYDIPASHAPSHQLHHSSSSSISSTPHLATPGKQQQLEKLPTRHDWVIKTFTQPTQCMQCATYMTGVFRQGITCQSCHYNAHYRCTKFVPGVCPLPEMDKVCF